VDSENLPENGCVLVVDDDADVRGFLTQCLRFIGYKALQASCADEAVVQFGQHRDEITCVLTDMIMPGQFGDRLALRLLAIEPDLKIVFMSGNPPSLLESCVPLEPGRNFLQKPFAIQDLRECLSQHLAIVAED
jgi:two-component system cell cycle sensor histidine kinase/response regulator CckA